MKKKSTWPPASCIWKVLLQFHRQSLVAKSLCICMCQQLCYSAASSALYPSLAPRNPMVSWQIALALLYRRTPSCLNVPAEEQSQGRAQQLSNHTPLLLDGKTEDHRPSFSQTNPRTMRSLAKKAQSHVAGDVHEGRELQSLQNIEKGAHCVTMQHNA